MREPASIRYMNPGAMWPGKIATKWGSKRWIYLNDGTGQGGHGKGNKIAIFDNWVDGICAQLDLWRTSPNYKNKKFKDAIATWAGGNNVPSYISYVLARIPGMTRDTVMNDAFWRGPMGIAFLKAQSGHEAGKPIPAPDADWIEAQRRVFAQIAKNAAADKKAGGVVAGGTVAATVAHHFDFSTPIIIAVVLVAAAIAIAIWRSKK
jgi:hypothetical protein